MFQNNRDIKNESSISKHNKQERIAIIFASGNACKDFLRKYIAGEVDKDKRKYTMSYSTHYSMCKKGEKEKHALINFTLDNSLPFRKGGNNCEEPLECEVFGIGEWLPLA